MRFKNFFQTVGLFFVTGSLYAQAAATGGTGSQPLSGEAANVYQGISTFFSFIDPAQGAASLLNFIATLFYNGLLWVYGFIGTFLIPIPDVSQASTFLNGSSGIVNNIYDIFVCLGVYVALCGLAINAAVLASGLGKGQVSIAVIVRSVVAIAFIWAWPVVFSFFAQVFTATGYLIFGQNTITTSGMFDGLAVMGTTSVSGAQGTVASNPGSQNQIPNTSPTISQGFQAFWGVAYRLCFNFGVGGNYFRRLGLGQGGSKRR